LDEGTLDTDESIVELGVVAVDRDRELTEAGLHGPFEELRPSEHSPVRDDLHALVPDCSARANEAEKVGMNRRLAATEDESLSAVKATLVDVGEHRLR
jgi:hypothetical protein